MQNFTLLDLGTAITDVLAFLGPADQHKLRRTSAAMCEWFDSAAENGTLAFFVTFAPPPAAAAAGPLRWRHAAVNPRGVMQKKANHAIPPATVTVHLRNYCLSSLNAQAGSEADDGIIEKAAIWLVDDFAFEHKLVVTGLFGIRSIGDGFCECLKAVEVEFKGEGSQLRSVGKDWLSHCPNLRSVTFSGFGALEKIGYCWMAKCSSLESITFAGDMPKLRKVGGNWLSGCPKLKQVDLTGFTALEEVGGHWMSDCYSLARITFAMPKLKKVGSSWMASCKSLRYADLTGFTTVEEVSDFWLSSCSSLESISFGDMPRLKKVGSSWMYKCSALMHLDLTGFIALEEVGGGWMYDCPSLVSIAFAGDMPKLKKVGWCWMYKCSSLKQVDLTGFTALEEVCDHWLSDCSSLESITFAGDMPKLKKVGKCWMADCSNLKHVSLTAFTALEEVGDNWLCRCTSLARITFAGDMPKLMKVGESWTPQSARSLSGHLLYLSKSKYVIPEE